MMKGIHSSLSLINLQIVGRDRQTIMSWMDVGNGVMLGPVNRIAHWTVKQKSKVAI